MKNSIKNMDALLDRVGLDEGFRSKPYHCSQGYLTIGYGLNLENGISKDEARYLLRSRINKAIESCERLPWFEGLSDNRKRVIVNMVYNLGMTRFKRFKKTIAFIKAGDFQSASIEMLDSAYARQVGPRAKRLSKRLKEG